MTKTGERLIAAAKEAVQNIDLLIDRNCVILDGKCDCPRQEGKLFPECKLYTR